MFFIAESIQSFSGIIFYAPKIGDISSLMTRGNFYKIEVKDSATLRNLKDTSKNEKMFSLKVSHQ